MNNLSDAGSGHIMNDVPDPPPDKNIFIKESKSLNILLGTGILGALFISIWIFGGFTPNMQNKLLSASRGSEFRLFSGISILLEGKMTGLISIAFGALMVIILKVNRVAGHLRVADFFMRRQLWLIVLGVLNSVVFLWTNDILFHLGIMGILLFPFFRSSPIKLLVLSFVLLIVYSGKNYWNYHDNKVSFEKYQVVSAVEKKIKADSALNAGKMDTALVKGPAALKKDTLTKQQTKDKEAWEGIVASMKYDAKKDEENSKALREQNYSKLYNHLLPVTQAREAAWTYRTGIWEIGSMMFLGMALLGFGFFAGRLSAIRYLLLAVVFITAGFLLGWYRFYFHIEAVRDYTKYISRYFLPHNLFYPFEIGFTATGYTALIMFFIRGGIIKSILGSMNAAGKLGVTNYMMQTVVCGIFFTGPGMGYYARLDQYQLYLFVLEVCLVQIVFSVLWLRWFYEGPVEWLWRCLILGKLLPVKRKDPLPQQTPSSVVL